MSYNNKMIVMKENENLSNFLEKDDYIIIFFDMLRDFAFSKNPKLSPRINMSYLIKNYLKDFERHYGLKDER